MTDPDPNEPQSSKAHEIEPPSVEPPSEGALIRQARQHAVSLRPLRALIPERIGRFTVHELIGEGTFGAVYRASDPELERIVALKVPRATATSTPGQLSRIRREARTAASLRHRNIVRVHELIEEDGVPIIVSEFVEGCTFADLIERGEQSLSQHLETLERIARAVEHAHRQGIVHRDLKPANVLIDPEGQPQVTDFGLARRDEGLDTELTQTGAALGTPAYMSPEQCVGERVGVAADIYGLGVMLYRVVTGRVPFTESGPELYQRIQFDPPPLPSRFVPTISGDLETVILTAIAKQPEDRYTTAAAFADDLRAILNDEPISVHSRGGWSRVRRLLRDTPHAEMMEAFAPVILLESLLYLLIGSSTAVFHHVIGFTTHWPYFALWGGLMAMFALLGPKMYRFTRDPNFMARHMISMFWLGPVAFVVLVVSEMQAGLPVLTLSPLFPLIPGFLMLVAARALSGKLYLSSAGMILCGLLMMGFPGVRMWVFVAIAPLTSFLTGWTFLKRRRVRAETGPASP